MCKPTTQRQADSNRVLQQKRRGTRPLLVPSFPCACGISFTSMGIRRHQLKCAAHKATAMPSEGDIKECIGCRRLLPRNLFWSNRGQKDGLVSRCKVCSAVQSRGYYVSSPSKLQRARAYQIKHRDLILARQKIRYEESKKDPAKLERRRARQCDYVKRRKQTDIGFRIMSACRNRLYEVLARTRRPASSVKLIGCSPADLKTHLEKQFDPNWTWSDWGRAFEIDHIRPCYTFDLTDPNQQMACFHYTNLRPLLKATNRAWRSQLTAA